jgi:hypothetical protein
MYALKSFSDPLKLFAIRLLRASGGGQSVVKPAEYDC